MALEAIVLEEVLSDFYVRYLETDRDGYRHFYAAASPVREEWCYLADAVQLEELQVASRALLEDETTRAIFVRCSALMGIDWNEAGMVPLLQAQLENGTELMAKAPNATRADPEQLRTIRGSAVASAEQAQNN